MTLEGAEGAAGIDQMLSEALGEQAPGHQPPRGAAAWFWPWGCGRLWLAVAACLWVAVARSTQGVSLGVPASPAGVNRAMGPACPQHSSS